MNHENLKKPARPFVHLIMASEFDESVEYIQKLRHKYDCILVGRKTIESHNPTLTAKAARPLRLVAGSLSNINREWTILNDEFRRKTIIVATGEEIKANPDVAFFLEKNGVALLPTAKGEDGRVELKSMLKSLASLRMRSLLLEGGQTLATAFLKQGLVDKVTFIVAPDFTLSEKIPEGIEVEILGDRL